MSRILKNVHASAKRLHDAGYMDPITMREFDALCLPELRDYSLPTCGAFAARPRRAKPYLRPFSTLAFQLLPPGSRAAKSRLVRL